MSCDERKEREAAQSQRTFCFAGYYDQHLIDDPACQAGECGATRGFFAGEYPKRCRCGGLIHANVDWSRVDEAYWGPDEQCDRCGGSFAYASEDGETEAA